MFLQYDGKSFSRFAEQYSHIYDPNSIRAIVKGKNGKTDDRIERCKEKYKAIRFGHKSKQLGE